MSEKKNVTVPLGGAGSRSGSLALISAMMAPPPGGAQSPRIFSTTGHSRAACAAWPRTLKCA